MMEFVAYKSIPVYEIRHIGGYRVNFYIYPYSEQFWALDWTAYKDGKWTINGLMRESNPEESFPDLLAQCICQLSLCEHTFGACLSVVKFDLAHEQTGRVSRPSNPEAYNLSRKRSYKDA